MDVAKDFEPKIKTLLETLKQEFANIRTNRPTAKLVENIKVDYLGQQLMVKQLASISIAPPREIDISPWDKGAAAPIARAIEMAGLGVTTSVNGSIVRVVLPVLTAERRAELIKLVKNTTEQMRIKMRSLRDYANKNVERLFKEKQLSEDQKMRTKKQIQEATDKVNKEIETLLEGKIKEINE